jgi:hypothetical protein
MDLAFSSDDLALVALVGRAVAGPSAAGEFDHAQWEALRNIVLPRLAGRPGLLPAAAIVTEAARLGSLTPLGVHTLVLPAFGDAGLIGPGAIAAIAEAGGSSGAPVRYGADAEWLIRYEDDVARLHAVVPDAASHAIARYVFPLGVAGAGTGAPIASAPAAVVRRRHRLAIAAEAVGAMDSALTKLCAYVSRRRQFGQPLGSLQAIQHRLAELAIDLEMGRWLTRQAAWEDADEPAAVAAAFIVRAARRFAWETHQLSGARGFTIDFGLGHDTLRLQALSVEAGGARAHEAEAYSVIWATRDGI